MGTIETSEGGGIEGREIVESGLTRVGGLGWRRYCAKKLMRG